MKNSKKIVVITGSPRKKAIATHQTVENTY